jgi:hypothetical protein
MPNTIVVTNGCYRLHRRPGAALCSLKAFSDFSFKKGKYVILLFLGHVYLYISINFGYWREAMIQGVLSFLER